MTVTTEETENQEALSSIKFEGKLQLALEWLSQSIRRSLLGISKGNSAYMVDYIINELKGENNASVNYVRMKFKPARIETLLIDLINDYKVNNKLIIVTSNDMITDYSRFQKPSNQR